MLITSWYESKNKKIGNSQGILLPKEVIERCKLQDEVEISVSDDQTIIRAPKYKRNSWEAAFKKAAGKDEGVMMKNSL